MAASTTPPNKRRRNRSAGVAALHFHGDSDSPEALEKVLDRRPIPGNPEAAPDEVIRARTERTLWLPPPANGKRHSRIHIDDPDPEHGYQRMTIDQAGHDGLHLPGRIAERQAPEALIRDVNPAVGSGAHRPEWIGGTYYPRPVQPSDRWGSLRRMNGRSVSPLYVFGPDDRREYRDSTWPWGLVGKIFTSDGFTGTGALIGPRLVATAGHMVPWGKSPWWMRFVPAFYNGSSLHGPGFESYVSDANGYDVNGSVTGYDWAVLRLYQPLGSSLGYFGYNGFSSSWLNQPYWTLLGYPGGVANGQRPSYQAGFSMFDIDSDSNGGEELESQADMTPGNSGGPSFGWWNGDPRLVGVVSGQEEDWTPGGWPWEWADTTKGNVVAGGAGFTNLMAWGRTNWP
jgi:V8-like Glu-specific endopeptidase